MKEMVIRWEEDPDRVVYFINENIVGDGDNGFDNIIKILSEEGQIETVMLKINNILSFGGESFESTLPFAVRYNEFKKAIGKRKLLIKYF
jgi:hypothetical protein